MKRVEGGSATMVQERKVQLKPVDAGLRSLEHYNQRLPPWRRKLREDLIPIVRWETPHLAALQDKYRSPNLDSYFAFTANLGTHTFFMTILPILFWCGRTELGRAMVHMLAAGVFFSGFVKDFVCLPRPLSPPLQRISRSASAALEYGFPSTHSTNAVSVAIYAIYMIRITADPTVQSIEIPLQALFYFYATSIVCGRVYCGMHGFFDVVIGSLLGAAIGLGQIQYGPAFDTWIADGPFTNLLTIGLIMLILVRVHPEPADNCPCFDDSVAFAGVFLGIQIAFYQFTRSQYSVQEPYPGTVPFHVEALGIPLTILRIILGVLVIFGWRAVAKPALLRTLPPLFRIIGSLGLLLPRKFFLNVSQYNQVPTLRKDDNVIPPASEIPGMLTGLRHPRRRAISVGPQSEADAYEAMAFRDRKRRESQGQSGASPPRSPAIFENGGQEVTQALSNGKPSEQQSEAATEDDDDEALFRKLLRPRVRYDVEVVTKLIVYCGIAWLSLEGNPHLFAWLGLAPR